MKKLQSGLIAAILALAVQAHAILYDFTFTGGSSAAFGSLDVSGSLATSGFITITSGAHPGTYSLIPGDGNVVLSVLLNFQTDGLVFTAGEPFFDGWGLLFSDGATEINLWGNAPGNYSLWGAPPQWDPAVDGGTVTLVPSAVPDGGMTAMLLGMGMLAIGSVRRMVK